MEEPVSTGYGVEEPVSTGNDGGEIQCEKEMITNKSKFLPKTGIHDQQV